MSLLKRVEHSSGLWRFNHVLALLYRLIHLSTDGPSPGRCLSSSFCTFGILFKDECLIQSALSLLLLFLRCGAEYLSDQDRLLPLMSGFADIERSEKLDGIFCLWTVECGLRLIVRSLLVFGSDSRLCFKEVARLDFIIFEKTDVPSVHWLWLAAMNNYSIIIMSPDISHI